ncbi:uncharacterized protein LOC144650912 [Oculina patagonica]
MSSQEKCQKSGSSWVNSTAARMEFFLSRSDLESLAPRYPEKKEPAKGRPVLLWNSEDLRKVAEEKYGKEVYQAKINSRAHWRQIRNMPVINKHGQIAKRVAGSIVTRARRKKTKGATQIKAKELSSEQDDLDSNVELEALSECIKKCDKEQLEQIILLMAQKDTTYVSSLLNEVKQVALLPRSKFQLAESNLAQLLSTSDDETDSGNSVLKEEHEEESEDEQRVLNMKLEGTWAITIAAPQLKKGEEGSLEIILFSSGLSVNGDISFPTSCIFGDIVGFKPKSSIEDASMCFETRSKMCDKWYTGALRVFMSRDDEGLCAAGSFWSGFQKQDAANTFQFTGRKADMS